MQVMAGADERRAELVRLFAAHNALVEPDLLDALSDDADSVVRVQALFASLEEIPFHLDQPLWNELEGAHREAAEPAPPTRTEDPAAARARKEAMRKTAAAIYDGQQAHNAEALDDEDDAVDDHEGLDPDAVHETIEEDAMQRAEAFAVRPRSDWRPVAAQHEGRLDVTEDMTGNSTCEGTMKDFVSYFQDRYEKIAAMLRKRREVANPTPIERVSPGQKDVQMIGMVVEISATKNGHRLVEIEDPTGATKCLVNANETQLIAMADTLVRDEVIGVVGEAGNKGDIVFLTQILRPDLPRPDHSKATGADVPLMAAFLSDIHVGSNTFLTENWERMLTWLQGGGETSREREMAGRTKYLILPGDLVDGVGIYPGQQDELTIGDVYDQYGAFGSWMESLPDHLELVVQPGNHDAARPAEPQPAFTQEVRERFDHHHARFVANPARFSMHGVSTLGYHGSSLIDFATSVTHLEYEEPMPAMKQMLQSRHMAPLYGERTPVAPEHHDYLVIDDIPDVFVTGHVHVPGIETYRGVTMINCGTWQSQTEYQKMLNFTPEPAKMPLLDLQRMRATLVDFQGPAGA